MENQSTKELTITRVFDAPRELVFTAFSEAEMIRQWWAPQGWDMPVCTMDFRPGGEWRYCFRNAEGQEHWARAIYQQIEPGKQIVYRNEFIDSQGNLIEGLPSSTFTITFSDLAGKTQLTTHVRLDSAANLEKLVGMGFKQGYTQTLNNLEQFLIKEKQ